MSVEGVRRKRKSVMRISNLSDAYGLEDTPTRENYRKKLVHFFAAVELRLPGISPTPPGSRGSRGPFGFAARRGFLRDEEMCTVLGDILQGNCGPPKPHVKKMLTIEMRRIGPNQPAAPSPSPLSFREWIMKADGSRIQAKDIAACGKYDGETRKKLILTECFEMMLSILEFPFNTDSLQLKATELIGDILKELRSPNQALHYYLRGKQHADILNASAMKMTFLKKAALCYKDLLLHEQALFLLKQLMQVAWACSDISRELEVYDLIGMEYYYLGKMEKAIFYHERMMHRELEGDTKERGF